MQLHIETELENDSRWIAEVPDVPGAMAYGVTREAAIAAVKVLVLRVIADELEHGEIVAAEFDGVSFTSR